MIEPNTKLKISATSAIAASWGFNYYLKYYCNSSVYWSGKNIFDFEFGSSANPVLPNVNGKLKVTATDQ